MALISLELTAFRNLRSLSLSPVSGTNILWGSNGMGKTSVLEAIHLLALGRSFRSRHMDEIVHWESDFMRLNARAARGGQIGLLKQKGRLPRFQLNGSAISAAAQLAQNLPVELIHAETPALLTGSPGQRRNFMDRGLFFMHGDFVALKRRYDTAMRQRNQLLRQNDSAATLAPFEAQMALWGEQIDTMRRNWLSRFTPVVQELLEHTGLPWVDDIKDRLTVGLNSGWPKTESLSAALERSRQRDARLGHTSVGTHRADLGIEISKRPVTVSASNGQCKLLACLFTLAQGRLLFESHGRHPLHLFDDLSSELDARSTGAICRLAAQQNAQVFVTSLTEDGMDQHWDRSCVCKFPLEQLAEVA